MPVLYIFLNIILNIILNTEIYKYFLKCLPLSVRNIHKLQNKT